MTRPGVETRPGTAPSCTPPSRAPPRGPGRGPPGAAVRPGSAPQARSAPAPMLRPRAPSGDRAVLRPPQRCNPEHRRRAALPRARHPQQLPVPRASLLGPTPHPITAGISPPPPDAATPAAPVRHRTGPAGTTRPGTRSRSRPKAAVTLRRRGAAPWGGPANPRAPRRGRGRGAAGRQ